MSSTQVDNAISLQLSSNQIVSEPSSSTPSSASIEDSSSPSKMMKPFDSSSSQLSQKMHAIFDDYEVRVNSGIERKELASHPQQEEYIVKVGSLKDAAVISEVINTAFIEGDSYFKKTEFHKRLNDEGKDIISMAEEGYFPVIISKRDQSNKSSSSTILGSCICTFNDETKEAIFSHFAVPKRNGSCGIGTMLLAGMEKLVKGKFGAKTIGMKVINDRQVVREFYKKRGYEETGEVLPFPDPNQLVEKYLDTEENIKAGFKPIKLIVFKKVLE